MTPVPASETAAYLIISPAWVGDLVMSQALYKVLKQHHPDTPIDVLAPPGCAAILQRMPEVRRVLDLPIPHGPLALKTRFLLGKQLRQTAYKQAFVLPNAWKSALIPYFAHIPKRTGFVGELRYGLLNDARPLDKTEYPLMVQRFVSLAYPKGAQWDKNHFPDPQLTVTEATVAHSLATLSLEKPNAPILALAPGAAFGSAKRWPASYFAKLAEHYLAQQWQVWLLGAPNDQPVLDNIQLLTGNRCQIFSQQAPLDIKIDLLSLATLIVSNDSGLLHIGAALNRPTIGIYGSTTPQFTPPLGPTVATLEENGLACRPCFKRDCPLKGTAHLRCLTAITPDRVIAAARTLSPFSLNHEVNEYFKNIFNKDSPLLK